MGYGFCLPENPCDYYTVELRVAPESPLAAAKELQDKLKTENGISNESIEANSPHPVHGRRPMILLAGPLTEKEDTNTLSKRLCDVVWASMVLVWPVMMTEVANAWWE